MTSKLKCPFCGEELEYWNESTYQVLGCRCVPFPPLTGNERMWQALIQAKQDLEQSEKCCSAWETQALDYKAETIALSGKLEIARKALEDARILADTRCIASAVKTIDKALEKIEHKE